MHLLYMLPSRMSSLHTLLAGTEYMELMKTNYYSIQCTQTSAIGPYRWAV